MTLLHRLPIDNAYWLLGLDEAGGRHVVVDDASFEAWSKVDTRNASMWLMRGNAVVHAIGWANRGDVEELIYMIGQIPSPERHHAGSTIREAYVNGDCDVFAIALARMTRNTLVAITKSTDDEGRPIRLHQLIHAAVATGPYIYDIDGESDEDEWEASWSQNAGSWDETKNVVITRRRLESLQQGKITEATIHVAANAAWLIAGLTGQLSSKDIAVLAKQHGQDQNTGAAAA